MYHIDVNLNNDPDENVFLKILSHIETPIQPFYGGDELEKEQTRRSQGQIWWDTLLGRSLRWDRFVGTHT